MIVTLDLTPDEASLLHALSWTADEQTSQCWQSPRMVSLGAKLRKALDLSPTVAADARPVVPEGLLPRDCAGVRIGVDEAGNVKSISGTGPEIAAALGIDLGAEARRQMDATEGEAD